MSDRKQTPESRQGREWERSEGLERALRKREDYSRKKKTEYAGIYDSEGNTILEKHGKKGSVSFDWFESRAMEGRILTHNHPNDSCFSQADIDTAETNGLLEIRATTSTGKTFCLRRTNPADAKRGRASGFGAAHERAMNHYAETVVRPAFQAERARVVGEKPRSTDIRYKTHSDFVKAYNAWVDKYNSLANKYNAKIYAYGSSWMRDNAKKYGWSYREEQK